MASGPVRPSPAYTSRASPYTPSITGSLGDNVTPTQSATRFSISSSQKTIKFGKGKYATVELVPQPSDDPEDPLNWSRWRKDLNLVSLLFMVGLIGGMKTAFLTSGSFLTQHYGVSHTAIAALTAVPLMISTGSGLISSMTAKICGKRPMYLIATLLLFIGTVWNVVSSDNYIFCFVARVFQGLGWGVFDALVVGSIHDTYFEHERDLRVSIYNLLTIATTWGSPMLGGLITKNHGGFATQFLIINCLYYLAFPLILLGAGETTFDRSRTSLTPLPYPGLGAARPWRLRHRVNKHSFIEYLQKMKPVSFRARFTMSLFLQPFRALLAPTTCFLTLLSIIPYGALWGLTTTLSILTSIPPLALDQDTIGHLMTGPWVIASLVAGGACFYRGRFSRTVNYSVIVIGGMMALTGLCSYGLGIHNFMVPEPTPSNPSFTASSAGFISLPLLSTQLGILAGGSYVLDVVTRPVLARSVSFTSSNMTIAQRSTGDMNAGVIILRNLAAGIFVLVMPSFVTVYNGLKIPAISLGITQITLTILIVALWWFYDERIWRADGRIMGLVDLKFVKQHDSFFETD